ncbi:MAG: ABC di/oligopeptide transporter inner membrane subunit [Dehalococcoidia bacterium]|nr:MAG: ABC di/oligopeptide transporter inner membrane subunit [Dehalococcoidia bacterium]
MVRLLITRLAFSVPVLFFISVIAFVLLRLSPGDPARLQAGLDATPEAVEVIRKDLGLDQPLPTQYAIWISKVVRGDLGVSYSTRLPVRTLIAERLPTTAQIGLGALLLIVVIGLPLGIWAALQQDRLPDQIVRVVSLFGISVPNFVVGILLILLFGWVWPNVWPYEGFVSLTENPLASLRHTLLPALCLALSQVGIIARLTRASMLEVINQEYITAARAFGVPEREIIWKDALRNALLPVLTVLGVITGFLLGGSVVIESVFGIAGLGRLLVESFTLRDYPVTIGVMMFIATVFVMINLIVDVLYGIINPRIRAGYETGQAA